MSPEAAKQQQEQNQQRSPETTAQGSSGAQFATSIEKMDQHEGLQAVASANVPQSQEPSPARMGFGMISESMATRASLDARGSRAGDNNTQASTEQNNVPTAEAASTAQGEVSAQQTSSSSEANTNQQVTAEQARDTSSVVGLKGQVEFDAAGNPIKKTESVVGLQGQVQRDEQGNVGKGEPEPQKQEAKAPTPEQQLQDRVAKLEAENAELKKRIENPGETANGVKATPESIQDIRAAIAELQKLVNDKDITPEKKSLLGGALTMMVDIILSMLGALWNETVGEATGLEADEDGKEDYVLAGSGETADNKTDGKTAADNTQSTEANGGTQTTEKSGADRPRSFKERMGAVMQTETQIAKKRMEILSAEPRAQFHQAIARVQEGQAKVVDAVVQPYVDYRDRQRKGAESRRQRAESIRAMQNKHAAEIAKLSAA